jgi:hypothetical protein
VNELSLKELIVLKKWHLIKLHCVLLLLSGLSPTTHTRYSNSLKGFLKVACRGRKDPAPERTAEKGCWVELEIGYLWKEEKIHKKLTHWIGKRSFSGIGNKIFWEG